MAVGDVAQALPVAVGRGEAAAGVLDGLHDDHRDRVRALGLDDALDLGQQAGAERGLVLAVGGAAERVRVGHVRDRDRGRPELLLVVRDAGERERPERDPVVGAVARDRLGALRLAVGDVELADDLPGGLDGLRAAAGEEHVVEVAGHELGEPLGELDGGGVRSTPDGRERELLQLRGGDAGELLAVGVADLGAEEARQPVEVAVALGVEHVRPLAAFEHEQRGRAAVAAEVQQEVVARRLLQWRIGQEHHRSILRSRPVCHRPGGGFGAGGCAGVSKGGAPLGVSTALRRRVRTARRGGVRHGPVVPPPVVSPRCARLPHHC